MINIQMLRELCEFEESVTSDTVQCCFNLNINGRRIDENTFSYVANTGDIKLIKYLHSKNCPWDKKTCENLAKGGYLDCLEYVHQHGCPWDETTCSAASSAGHLNCLTYAHTHGCPWDQFTTGYAAEKGQLACLKYAHTHGCPINKDVCLSVTKKREIIKYLQKHCSMPPNQ